VSAIQSFTRLFLILILVSGQMLGSSVSLAWTPNTETDLAGYYVYRTQTPGTNYTRLNTSPLTSASYVDSAATAGTTYYYTVSATNGSGAESGKSNEVQAVVPASTPTNSVPVANAGYDKTVAPSTSVTLQGSGSDADGDVLTYSWSQVSGPTVSLSGANFAAVSFTTPAVTADTTLVFRLTVNDGKGGTATDDVHVLVRPQTTNATISLNPSIVYQTMVGWEGVDTVGEADFPSQFSTWKDKVLDAAVELGINRVRLETKAGAENSVDYFTQYINGQITRTGWKAHWYDAVNDNSDPTSINQGGFQFSFIDFKIDNIVLPLKQRLAAKGEKLFVNLEYITGDPANGGPAALHSMNPNEYAEFILAHFKHMQSKYGWVPDQVEVVNEPVLARGWSATIVANCLVTTAKLLNANGFDPDFAAPSCIDIGGGIDWFNQMRQNVPSVMNYMTEFAYHRYGGETLQNIQTIGTFPAMYGVRTAMLEKFDGGGTYVALHQDLKYGQNSAWDQFALAFPVDDNGAQYFWIDINNPSVVNMGSRTKFLRQYFKFIRAGAKRIEAGTNNPAFDPLSFVNTNQGYVVVIKADQAGSIAINGLPAGTYGIKYTTNTQYNVDLAAVAISAGQPLVTSIPAVGVITVYAQAGGTPPTNTPPTANAGTDQTVSPGAAVTLRCSSTDPNGDPLTRSWSQLTGPVVTLQGANTATCTFTAPSVTTDTTLSFRLTVSDGKGGTSSDDVNVLDHPTTSTTNNPPTVNAGPDQSVAFPSSATLSGTASDDGLPNPPHAITATWSKVSGPGTVTFGNANALSTTASFSTAGTYVLRLTASDSILSASDDLTVTAGTTAGGSLSGSLATAPATVDLAAEGTLDWAHWGLTTAGSFNHKAGVASQISTYAAIAGGPAAFQPGPTNCSWTGGAPTGTSTTSTAVYQMGQGAGFQITVPADTTLRTLKLYLGLWAAQGKLEATLSDSSAPAFVNTSLANQADTSNAVYTLAYRASQAGQSLTVRWTIQTAYHASWGNVTLQAATLAGIGSSTTNQAPVVNAGPDRTVTLPNSANLSGAASDDGLPNPPATVSLTWSKVSGPGTVTFGSPNAASTSASFSAAGVYVLRLTGSDSLLSTSDDVQVTAGSSSVNSPPTAYAGTDRTVLSGTKVSLTGTGSDPNNDPITFAWSQLSGPTVSLSGANTATVTFTAPPVSRDTYLTFRIKVTDSKGAQATDDVQVRVRRNRSKVVAPASLNGVDPAVESSFVGIAVLNTSAQTDTVQVAAVTGNGSEQLVKSSVFAPQAQDAFLADSVTQNRSDVVSLKTQADNTDIQGFFMIGRGAPNQLDGVGGELQPDTELFFPIAQSDRSQRAVYFLTNTDTDLPANVSVEMVDQAGQVVKTGTLQLAPAASSLTSLDNLVGAGTYGSSNYLRITSDVPVQGFELMAGADDFSSAAAQRLTTVRTLWIPHFVLGPAGEDTELRVINPGAQAVEARLKIYNDQAVLLGTHSLSIPGRGMSVSLLSGLLGLTAVPEGQPFLTGHIVVDVVSPADGSANLVGTATFTGPAGRSKSTLPMWRRPSTDTLYLHVAQSHAQNVFTGLAVMNPNATAASITVRAWDKDGRATAEKTVTVEAGQRIVDLLNGSRLFGPAFEQVGGHLEVSSDQPVVSFVVFGDSGSQFLAAVEGQSNQ